MAMHVKRQPTKTSLLDPPKRLMTCLHHLGHFHHRLGPFETQCIWFGLFGILDRKKKKMWADFFFFLTVMDVAVLMSAHPVQ
jgi:hypothetical protein